MVTAIPRSIIILCIIVVAFLLDFVLMNRYKRQRQESRAKRAWSWDYTLLLVLACLLLVLQPVLLPWIGYYTPRAWGAVIQILGLALVVCALLLHGWARLHLRQFYAERVEIQAEHRLVDTGPYRLVRHPIIVSFFGIAIGLFLFNPAVTTLLMLVYTFWDFLHAARQEDELLSKSLPGYADYMKRTPRFLPRLRGKRPAQMVK
ncbi:MAG: isoprenylcysteine carboxylmethyltransferase family protein [Anaerolineales bacterium]